MGKFLPLDVCGMSHPIPCICANLSGQGYGTTCSFLSLLGSPTTKDPAGAQFACPEATRSAAMPTGTVKWFNTNQRIRIHAPDTGWKRTCSFHISAVEQGPQ